VLISLVQALVRFCKHRVRAMRQRHRESSESVPSDDAGPSDATPHCLQVGLNLKSLPRGAQWLIDRVIIMIMT
jgi:hypothetical protein